MVILIFLFSFIGISASDFFCPNLSTIAAYLGLNESTAGVTFLAFGNGSPDVFSTFAALKGGTFGLAIGELIGAATFSKLYPFHSANHAQRVSVVSIVVGTIALIQPFHVPKHAFSRDILFFTCAVLVLIAVLRDGHLTPSESGGMVILYFTYVLVVVIGNWWSRRQRRKEDIHNITRQQEYRASLPDLSLPEPVIASPADSSLNAHLTTSPPNLSPTASPRPGFSHTRSRSHTTVSRPSLRLEPMSSYADTPRANFSLLGAVEFRDVVNALRKENHSHASTPNQTPRSPSREASDYFGPIHHGHRRSVSQGVAILRKESSRRPATLHPYTRRESGPSIPSNSSGHMLADPLPSIRASADPNPWEDQLGRPDRPLVIIPGQSESNVPSISVTDPTGHPAPDPLPTPPVYAADIEPPRFGIRRHSKLVLRVIFPSLQAFRRKSYIGMLLAILSVPAIFALTLTLPVVDDGQKEGGVALPTTRDEPLQADLEPGMVPEADEDRLVRSDVGEELHHLVESGFRPLHSPLGRMQHSSLRRVSEDVSEQGSLSKELLEDLREEEALEFHKYLTAVQCVLGPMFCVLIIFRELRKSLIQTNIVS